MWLQLFNESTTMSAVCFIRVEGCWWEYVPDTVMLYNVS